MEGAKPIELVLMLAAREAAAAKFAEIAPAHLLVASCRIAATPCSRPTRHVPTSFPMGYRGEKHSPASYLSARPGIAHRVRHLWLLLEELQCSLLSKERACLMQPGLSVART